MKLPAQPGDYASLMVSLSRLLTRNRIMGSYDGITLFCNELPSIEQIDRQAAAILAVSGHPDD